MIDNSELWLKRARDVLGRATSGDSSEAVPFAASMLTALYGSRSTHLKTFMTGLEMDSRKAFNTSEANWRHLLLARGAITNAIAELEGGLITNLRVLVAGEILSELVPWARKF